MFHSFTHWLLFRQKLHEQAERGRSVAPRENLDVMKAATGGVTNPLSDNGEGNEKRDAFAKKLKKKKSEAEGDCRNVEATWSI